MQNQISSPANFQEILNLVKEDIIKIAGIEAMKIGRDVADMELDLFEFNLSISSLGTKKINECSAQVQSLRKKKLDLSKYEKMCEDF